MKIIAEGTAKEIAALVLELQERQEIGLTINECNAQHLTIDDLHVPTSSYPGTYRGKQETGANTP